MPKRQTVPPVITPATVTPEHLDRLVRAGDGNALQALVGDPAVPPHVWRVTDPNPYAFDPLLVSAAVDGHVELIGVLLKTCDPNEVTSFGDTPLMAAALHGKVDALDALLPVSNPHATNKAGQTALMLTLDGLGGEDHAAHLACVDKLAPVSDLHAEDDHGMTALLIVASLATAIPGEDSAPYWACADRLAEGSRRDEALRVWEQAPSGSMPRFAAVLEREALANVAPPDSPVAVPASRRRRP